MKRIITVLALFFLAIGMLSGCKSAGPEVTAEPKSAEDELIDLSIAAQGGLEAFAAINTMVMNGSVMVEGMDLPISMYNKRPAKSKRVVEVPMMGMEIVSAFDGEVAWELNPMMGSSPRKLSEERTQMEKHGASIEGDLIGYKEKGSTVALEGEEQIGDTMTRKLVLTRADGTAVTMYIDAETYLPIRVDGEGIDGQTGAKVQQQTALADYKEYGGIMLPTKMTIKAGPSTLVINLTDVVINEEIDDAEFAFPGDN